jgi:hypothetical protein
MRRFPVLAIVMLAGSWTACAGSTEAPADTVVEVDVVGPDDAMPDPTGDEAATPDAEPETEGIDAIDDEATGDGPFEAAEPGPIEVPWMPPAYPNPIKDEPFVQEYNSNPVTDVEPGIGPLVAVVIPPPGATGMDNPTQVTQRGYVVHDAGATKTVTIPEGHPDLVTAAMAGTTLVLAGPRHVYLRGDGEAIDSHEAPAGTTIRGLAPGDGRVWVLTDKGFGPIVPGGATWWPESGEPILAALESGTDLLVAYADRIDAFVALSATRGLPKPSWSIRKGQGLDAGAIASLVADAKLPKPLDLVVVGDKAVQGFILDDVTGKPALVDVPEFAANRVPLDRPRQAAPTWDGGFVVATAGGAYRMMDRGAGPEWRVYNQERWVPSEDVRGVATDPSQDLAPIHFATAGGLATATSKRITLEEKYAAFIDRIVKRHDRYGAVADSHLTKKGDLSSNIPWDSDNDGSWTSYWLLSECFRWKVTGAADARANFDEALDGMLRLRDLGGAEWFLARSVIRIDTCQMDDCDGPDDGLWAKATDKDGVEWWVKHDTSNDEVDAHVFMMGHTYDLCADETQKARIRNHISKIVGGIIDHGYKLIDPLTGKETTYGQWDPEYVNVSASGLFGDGGERSLQMMSSLTMAHYMTGDPKFLEAKAWLMLPENHYDVNVLNELDYVARPGHGDNDEMSMYAYFPLMRLESDPALRALWSQAWKRLYETDFLPQQAAWWDVVNATVGGPSYPLDDAVRWLRLAPVDMIRWDVHNSHRKDLIDPPWPFKYRGMMRSDGRIIPYDERRCDRWNTSQFMVDGGMGGVIEMDGADALAGYWASRYYGFIVK